MSGSSARSQGPAAAALEMRTVAELIQPVPGTAGARLVPADHVVPGDHVVYTVEVHNVSGREVHGVVFTNPVPAHMSYIADSAAGPGADIVFSVDNGQSFGKAAQLRVALAEGADRAARPEDYTHIRWTLKFPLCAACVAFARFRATLR